MWPASGCGRTIPTPATRSSVRLTGLVWGYLSDPFAFQANFPDDRRVCSSMTRCRRFQPQDQRPVLQRLHSISLLPLLAFTLVSVATAGETSDSGHTLHHFVSDSIPRLDYTPFGYIDNPYHSMVFNRSGVIRSMPPLGFGWWRTAFEGNYGGGVQDHVNYLSLLQMSVTIGGTVFLYAGGFHFERSRSSSEYHTKHLISYDWSHQSVHASLRFFLPREHTLACMAELRNDGEKPAKVVDRRDAPVPHR